jgi:hypothetical protein
MDRLLSLAAALCLTACMIPGHATVQFVNAAGIPVNFTLDGAGHPSNPVADGHTVEWAGINPGSHVLGASDPAGAQPATSETKVLEEDHFYLWRVTSGLSH